VREEVNKEHWKNGTEQIKCGYTQLTVWRGKCSVGEEVNKEHCKNRTEQIKCG
jgi:hypothetical protein